MRYRKKCVEVEAVQISQILGELRSDLPAWVKDARRTGELQIDNVRGVVFVKTLEGEMAGQWDDWLVRGVRGELYPVKKDIFAETYEHTDGRSLP